MKTIDLIVYSLYTKFIGLFLLVLMWIVLLFADGDLIGINFIVFPGLVLMIDFSLHILRFCDKGNELNSKEDKNENNTPGNEGRKITRFLKHLIESVFRFGKSNLCSGVYVLVSVVFYYFLFNLYQSLL